MTNTHTHRIAPKHETTLANSAIPLEYAQQWGIYSATAKDSLQNTDLNTPNNQTKSGILFPLRRLDGTITWQLRLDKPEDDRKYVQAPGTGAIINIPEPVAHLTKTADNVLIVEGTKQTIAATLYAPQDTLVVGIQGCSNFSKNGVPLQEWQDIIKPGANITICFDADWKRNPNVWSAAAKLKGHLEIVCAAKQVKLVQLEAAGVSGTNGLDDFLAGIKDPNKRNSALQKLIDSATQSIGRQPAKKQKLEVQRDESIRVEWEKGRIVKTTNTIGLNGDINTKEEVVLGAAAQIVESEAHIDEETGEATTQRLTLEVAIKMSDDIQIEKHQVRVPSNRLAEIGTWLDLLPGGIGVAIPRKSKPDDDVANAIRTHNTDILSRTVIPRIGWFFDTDTQEWRWCDGKGAIGATDKVNYLRGEPASRDFQSINLPAPDEISPTRLRKLVREFIYSRDLFNDNKKFSWDVGLAGWGLSFLGVTPNAAVCWFGPPSSGKSTISQTLASSLSATWAPSRGNAMSTFNARPAGMDLLANGMYHVFLHVDDLKPETDRTSMAAALKAFDALLRRAHGSGGAVRGDVDRSSGSLGVRKVDGSAPMMFITGEEIPTGEGFAESGLDRALFIQVQPKTQLRDENSLQELQRRAGDGRFKHVTSGYLAWIAQRIDQMKLDEDGEPSEPEQRFDLWRLFVDRARHEAYAANTQDGIFTSEDNVSDRAKMLAASLGQGFIGLLEFAMSIEALTPTETEELWGEFGKSMREAVLSHTRDVMGGNTSASEQALDRLRDAVSAKEVSIDPNEHTNRPVVGEFKYLSEGKVLALNHKIAAKAVGFNGGVRAFLRALGPALLRDPATGRVTRRLHINGVQVQACVIPITVWDEDHPGD